MSKEESEIWIDPVGTKVYIGKKPELCPDYSFKVIREQTVKNAFEDLKKLCLTNVFIITTSEGKEAGLIDTKRMFERIKQKEEELGIDTK